MRRTLAFAFGLALLAGCNAPPILKQSDTHIGTEGTPSAGAIPALVPITPALPRPKQVQKPETYSVVVNGVKVQELLFALARDAKLNVDIHSGITGVVTMNAIDQTLPQLLSRISKQVEMRWEFDPPNLIVMPDSPYLRVYSIDYVNMERGTTGTVGVSSQIGSGGASGGGAGGAGGNTSTTTLRSTSNNKFWETLVENVKDILRETDKIVPTGSGPNQPPVAAPAAPASQPSPPGILGALTGGGAGQSASQLAPPGTPGGPPGATPNTTFREAASVIANSEAGVLSIRATSRQHERIQEFLDKVLVSARRQVLIEATIIEVQLNNQFQQGINWSLLRRGPSGVNITQAPVGGPAATPTQGLFIGNLVAPAFNLGNLSATVQLLESFGNVRVLSSPKISVLNNQTAILRVVDEVVYFDIQVNQSVTGTAGTTLTTFNTSPRVTSVGFVMNVTPQIGESDIVLLNVRPSLTRIARLVPDPNPSLGVIQNLIPEIRRREMESLIKINSGQIAVMGGLIQDSINDLEDGIPGLRSSEGIGQLFGQRNRTNTKTELVVFLRPLVIKDPSIDGDYRSYRVLAPDEGFTKQQNPALSAGEER